VSRTKKAASSATQIASSGEEVDGLRLVIRIELMCRGSDVPEEGSQVSVECVVVLTAADTTSASIELATVAANVKRPQKAAFSNFCD
jgi:hypothetical protein